MIVLFPSNIKLLTLDHYKIYKNTTLRVENTKMMSSKNDRYKLCYFVILSAKSWTHISLNSWLLEF